MSNAFFVITTVLPTIFDNFLPFQTFGNTDTLVPICLSCAFFPLRICWLPLYLLRVSDRGLGQKTAEIIHLEGPDH